MIPVNTPTGVPCSDAGGIPAFSRASQLTSSRIRCWGSIAVASRGEIPKNPASKPAASCRNPPSRAYVVPGRSGSGSYSAPASHPRPAGNPLIASRPAATSSHSCPGLVTWPG